MFNGFGHGPDGLGLCSWRDGTERGGNIPSDAGCVKRMEAARLMMKTGRWK